MYAEPRTQYITQAKHRQQVVRAPKRSKPRRGSRQVRTLNRDQGSELLVPVKAGKLDASSFRAGGQDRWRQKVTSRDTSDHQRMENSSSKPLHPSTPPLLHLQISTGGWLRTGVNVSEFFHWPKRNLLEPITILCLLLSAPAPQFKLSNPPRTVSSFPGVDECVRCASGPLPISVPFSVRTGKGR